MFFWPFRDSCVAISFFFLNCLINSSHQSYNDSLAGSDEVFEYFNRKSQYFILRSVFFLFC
jgi:hypothetical protein